MRVSPLQREKTQELVARVVDRESYMLALQECADEERILNEKLARSPIPYRIHGLGAYHDISSQIETDVLIDRDICLAKLGDEACLKRWPKKPRRRQVAPNIDKECVDDRADYTHPTMDGAHGWHRVNGGESGFGGHGGGDWSRGPWDSTYDERRSNAARRRFARHFSFGAMLGRLNDRIERAWERTQVIEAAPGSPAHDIGAESDMRLDLPPLSCCNKPGHLAHHTGPANVPNDWAVIVRGRATPAKFKRIQEKIRELRCEIEKPHRRFVATLKRVRGSQKIILLRSGHIVVVTAYERKAEIEDVCSKCNRFGSDCIRLGLYHDDDASRSYRDEDIVRLRARVISDDLMPDVPASVAIETR
jgi:hypothetical protein